MRVIFAGTPEFARVALERLHAAGHEIVLVLTQPDRPAGRGLKLQASAVKTYALAHELPVAQPRSLRLDGKFPEEAAAAKEAIQAARADVMVVAAYGLILPQWVLEMMDCLNIHASLLPRWRGAAPIHRAIEAGDAETGVTIMQMDTGLDTGDMLLVQSLPIVHSGPQADTTGSLHDKLAALGGDLIVRALELAAGKGLQPKPQPQAGITYAHKIDKSESAVDWALGAEVIERRIRAFNPTPGASTELGNDTFKLWRSEIHSYSHNVDEGYGTILGVNSTGIDVACGSGVLRLTELQRAGGKRLSVADLLRGAADLQSGARFGKLAA